MRLKLPEFPLPGGGRGRVTGTGHLERNHAAEGTRATRVDKLHETNIGLAACGASAGGASRDLDSDRLVGGNADVSESIKSLLGSKRGK